MNHPSTPYAAVSTRARVDSTWPQALLALTLLSAWTLFLYRETGLSMVSIWARSDTFTHAFLVPPLVLWLVWRKRELVAQQAPQPMRWPMLLLVGVALLWLVGDLASVNALTQLALVALLVLAVPTLLGWPVARLVLFPLGFLFFAVPIGEFLLPQFMEWTANFTVLALRLSGIAVYREGLQFVIPSGHWSVIEACSGVRYLIASFTVGTLFAYLNYQSNQRRWLFALVSLLVPIMANWMRAYGIVMLGHLSGNKVAVGVDHLVYGWLFFGIVMLLMFIIGARWAEPEPLMRANMARASTVAAPVSPDKLWLTVACCAALVSAPHVALWALAQGDKSDAVQMQAPPALGSDWRAIEPSVANFKPNFEAPSAQIHQSYATAQGQAVGLYLGYYRAQNYERKLISSNNMLVASEGASWAQVSQASRVVRLADKALTLRSTELRETSQAEFARAGRLLVWQFYWVNGVLTSNDYVAKVQGVLSRLLGRGDDAAVIVLYTPKDQSGGAEAVLASFLAANYPALETLLLATQQHH